MRRWRTRPGQQGYYVSTIAAAVMALAYWVAERTAWGAVTAFFVVGVALYRFLAYPPTRHSQALRDLRERQRLHAPDLRRPD